MKSAETSVMKFKLFSNNNKELGNKGERLAERFLRRQRYKIIERNYRTRGGEVDIIAKDGNQLVFIEVKTRSSDNQEFLRTSVNRGKSKRLAKTAVYYLKKNKYQGVTARFDVVFVIIKNGSPPHQKFWRGDRHKIELVKDAFRLDQI